MLASASDLPETGDAGFRFEQTATVPAFVPRHFVRQRWSWADEGHVSRQHVPELRELVEARSAKQMSQRRHARIVHDLEHDVRPGFSRRAGLDEVLHILLMNPMVGIHVHGAELEHRERSACLSDTLLPVEHGPFRRELDKS